MRRSRACSRVETDSPMREMASLSGLMLKLFIVWLMSYMIDGVSFFVRLLSYVLRTVAGSSERSILAVVLC